MAAPPCQFRLTHPLVLMAAQANGPQTAPGQLPLSESADCTPAAAGRTSSSSLPLELPALPTPAKASQPATAASASSPGVDGTLAALHQLVMRSRQRVSAVRSAAGGAGTADTQQARGVRAAGPQRQAPQGVEATASSVPRAAARAAPGGSPSPGCAASGNSAAAASRRPAAAALTMPATRSPSQPVASAVHKGAASASSAPAGVAASAGGCSGTKSNITGSGTRQPRGQQPTPVALERHARTAQ
jgi:hypothetical protein